MTTENVAQTHYLYWLDDSGFELARQALRESGAKLRSAIFTPCELMRARDERYVYAKPSLWSRICVRQGSWYRASARNGQTMLMGARKLPAYFDTWLDSELRESDFKPTDLPDTARLEQLATAQPYMKAKPATWENKTWLDALMFKTLFLVTRFWGLRDSLNKHWAGHRANHANFITRDFTTEVDGEDVPYSVTDNASVCSACAEYFNVNQPETRKLVRACPGAVIFGGTKRSVYVDVKPMNRAAGTGEASKPGI